MSDDSIPLKYRGLLQRVRTIGSKSKAEAIKGMCLECVSFKYKSVTNCTSGKCPLFQVRPYQIKKSTGIEVEPENV